MRVTGFECCGNVLLTRFELQKRISSSRSRSSAPVYIREMHVLP